MPPPPNTSSVALPRTPRTPAAAMTAGSPSALATAEDSMPESGDAVVHMSV
jgi:hypothetical protein